MAAMLEARSNEGSDLAGDVTYLEEESVLPSRTFAYSSNETGSHEVHVRPFPDLDGGQWEMCLGGGVQPIWSDIGEELFYLSPDSQSP